MELRSEVLVVGFALQGAICLVNAATTTIFARRVERRLHGLFVGAWAALAAYYGIAATGIAAVPSAAPSAVRFAGSLVATGLYFGSLALLGAGSRALAVGEAPPALRKRWLVLVGGLAGALSLAFALVPSQTPLAFFLRVGLRSLVGAVVVAIGVAVLWRLPEAASLTSPRALAVAIGAWGSTQLYYGATSLFGAFGWQVDRPSLRTYLPFLGALTLAVAGLAVIGWMLETEFRRGVRVEAELRESEEKFRTLIEVSPVGFFLDDARGNAIYVNDRCAELVGVPAAQALGRDWVPLLHPDDRERVVGLWLNSVEHGVAFQADYRWIHPDGRVVWTRGDITPVRDERGDLLVFIGTLIDITERKEAEEALRESEARLRLSVAAADVGLWDWDLQTNRVHYSPEWKRQIGYRDEEIGEDFAEWRERVHPDDLDPTLQAVQAFLAAPRGRFETEFRFRHKDGTYRWIHTQADVLRDASGAPVRMLGCHVDVTDRVALEARLLQSQKVEAIGRLAGGIAHDFNNLLTVILGSASCLGEELPGGSPWRRDVAAITESAERAAALTRQLLAFARRQVVNPRTIDLGRAVEGMGELLRRSIGPSIELAMEADPATDAVVIDPGQLQQVVLNLAVNARDAMPGGGRMRIRTWAEAVDEATAARLGLPKAGEYVVLEVQDSGSGLSAEARTHLFEPFFTTKGPEQGTGLGLATCFGIARQAGGTVVAAEAGGRGTTLRVYLPRAAGEVVGVGEEPAGATRSGTETVLVVDDQPALRMLAARALRDLGYRVLEAGDGVEAEAVSSAHDAPIEAMVTDVVMPRLGGLELTERLRSTRPGIRVLLISGYAQSLALSDRSLPPGCSFLQKPFLPSQLAERLRDLLDRPT